MIDFALVKSYTALQKSGFLEGLLLLHLNNLVKAEFPPCISAIIFLSHNWGNMYFLFGKVKITP